MIESQHITSGGVVVYTMALSVSSSWGTVGHGGSSAFLSESLLDCMQALFYALAKCSIKIPMESTIVNNLSCGYKLCTHDLFQPPMPNDNVRW